MTNQIKCENAQKMKYAQKLYNILKQEIDWSWEAKETPSIKLSSLEETAIKIVGEKEMRDLLDIFTSAKIKFSGLPTLITPLARFDEVKNRNYLKYSELGIPTDYHSGEPFNLYYEAKIDEEFQSIRILGEYINKRHYRNILSLDQYLEYQNITPEIRNEITNYWKYKDNVKFLKAYKNKFRGILE